jgi:hypothetical protein
MHRARRYVQTEHLTPGGCTKAVAAFPGKSDGIHVTDSDKRSISQLPNGCGALVKVLRVGFDDTDKSFL